MDDRFPAHLFVGVTTRQNTANLVPLVQFGAQHYLPIDTAAAARSGWGEGLRSVAQARGIAVLAALCLPDSAVSVADTITSLQQRLAEVQRVVWLLGGGRKAEQLAVWQVFRERCADGHDDIGCYAEPSTGETLLIRGLSEDRVETRADLSIAEILACFGRAPRESSPLRPQPGDREELTRFRTDPSYRQDRMRTARTPATAPTEELARLEEPEVKARAGKILSDEIRTRFHKVPPPNLRHPTERENFARGLLNQLLKPSAWGEPRTAADAPREKFSAYFERLVQQLVAQHTQAGCCNLKLSRPDDAAIDDAEYDVLLVTHEGTLISLDAKTFSVEGKDLDSRLLRLSRASGQLSAFVVVFPYFLQDIQLMPRELCALPFKLHGLRQPFAIVGASEADLVLAADETDVPRIAAQGEPSIRCQSLESYLRRQRLKT